MNYLLMLMGLGFAGLWFKGLVEYVVAHNYELERGDVR